MGHRLARRHTTNACLLSQLTLGRELIAGRKLSRPYTLANQFGQLVVQRDRTALAKLWLSPLHVADSGYSRPIPARIRPLRSFRRATMLGMNLATSLEVQSPVLIWRYMPHILRGTHAGVKDRRKPHTVTASLTCRRSPMMGRTPSLAGLAARDHTFLWRRDSLSRWFRCIGELSHTYPGKRQNGCPVGSSLTRTCGCSW